MARPLRNTAPKRYIRMTFAEIFQKTAAFLWNVKYYFYFCTTLNHTILFTCALCVVWCGVRCKYTTNSKKMKKSYDEFQRKCDFRTIAAFCALLAAIVFAPSYASAQNFTLQGSVKTEKGEPVPGATIILAGTQQGEDQCRQGGQADDRPAFGSDAATGRAHNEPRWRPCLAGRRCGNARAGTGRCHFFREQ